MRFERKSVRNHIKKNLPGCAMRHREKITQRVVQKKWRGVTLGKAVGITATCYIRHNLTQYEKLMDKHGLTRAEARIAESNAVKDIFEQWRKLSSPTDVSF
ncbi:DUF2293 domain-containing protein [Shimia sp. W99]